MVIGHISEPREHQGCIAMQSSDDDWITRDNLPNKGSCRVVKLYGLAEIQYDNFISRSITAQDPRNFAG